MKGKTHQTTKQERSFQGLRSRLSSRQEALELRLKDELKAVPPDDVVAQVRVRHKYRLLGLNLSIF